MAELRINRVRERWGNVEDQAFTLIAQKKSAKHGPVRTKAGVEMQAMLATRRRDIVDEQNRVMWAHGEKNDSRDRQVIVYEWAFAIILAYAKSAELHPDALLFPITEDTHRARWYETRDTLRTKGVAIPANYKPHSCRNTFAVRGPKTGRDPVLISSNLGHADTSELLRLYGKHRPAVTDLIRADQRSAGSK